MKVGIFIVGAPKAGTTSLHYYLNEHPEILMSSVKEPNFFSDKEITNQGLYYETSRINTSQKYHNLFLEKEDEKIKEHLKILLLTGQITPKSFLVSSK